MSLPRFISDLEAARLMVVALEASVQRLRIPGESAFEACLGVQRALTQLEQLVQQEFRQEAHALTSALVNSKE